MTNKFSKRTHHEDVICTRNMPSSLEKLHQIMKLAMDIAANSHRTVHRLNIGLLHQYFFDLRKAKARSRERYRPQCQRCHLR
jgi:hypothetical protein